MAELLPGLPSLPAGCEFHHLGYATESIEREWEFFAALGYIQETEKFEDPIQGIAGCFLSGPGPRVELLQSLPGANTLAPWVKAGIKVYHFGYVVTNLNKAILWAQNRRGKVISPPAPSVAFNGRYISFVKFRNGLMLEFIEKWSAI